MDLGAARPWPPERFDAAVFRTMAPLVQERVVVLGEVPAMVDFLFLDQPVMEDASWAAVAADPRPRPCSTPPWPPTGSASGPSMPYTAPPRRWPRPWAASSTRPRRRSGWPSPAGGWARPYSSPWRCSGARLYGTDCRVARARLGDATG